MSRTYRAEEEQRENRKKPLPKEGPWAGKRSDEVAEKILDHCLGDPQLAAEGEEELVTRDQALLVACDLAVGLLAAGVSDHRGLLGRLR